MALLWTSASFAQEPSRSEHIGEVARHFASPPDDARVQVRWWWFGPGVTKAELEREMLAMKAGGFGGFEIQPVYPLALDDPKTDFKNLPYLSPAFLDDVRFVADKAHVYKMRADLTLNSGWPYGGPHTPVTEAASELRMAAIDVPAGAGSFALPSISNGEELIAMFGGEGSSKQYDAKSLHQLDLHPEDGRVSMAPAEVERVVLCFISSRTGQQVKRAAVGAEGFVLDHLSHDAVADHLRTVADPLIAAFGDNPPYSVFSDSLEVYGTDWTPDFLAEFRRLRGYDLTPYLPDLFSGDSATALAVRHDWGLTQTDLVDKNYLVQINDWATAHHTLFRSQTYGEPAVSMSSNRLVALPEGEGPQWHSFSYTRWATSASHLYGRPVTSAETWTWLHSPAFRATPLDMKAEADRMFLEGVNQFVGHGWPYTPPGIPEPGWSFYAAGVFNDHNPWWIVMPDVNRYLQRVSYLMRQGKPVNDVAVLLPEDDAYASFTPGHTSVSDAMHGYITSELTRQILDAGFNLDYIDSEAIHAVGIPYRVLILPHVLRLSPEILRKIEAFAKSGGKVIAVGWMPSVAPGLMDATRLSAEVAGLSKSMLAGGEAKVVASDGDVGDALRADLMPDMQVSSEADDIGFVHRKLADADIYFIVNSSNHAVDTVATFRKPRSSATWWDPFTGRISRASVQPRLDLAPYESRVLVFTDGAGDSAPEQRLGEPVPLVDLSRDWQVHFVGRDKAFDYSETMASLKSWTDDPRTEFYSGDAVYSKDIPLTVAELQGKRVLLDFGHGTAVEADPEIKNGMRALLESPVREAAVVTINGLRAGSVWHPPYVLDVTPYLRAGSNHIEIRVGNLGINALAGRARPDYRLLTARYGERFVPQDMDHLKPLPSGILGPVRLLGETIH